MKGTDIGYIIHVKFSSCRQFLYCTREFEQKRRIDGCLTKNILIDSNPPPDLFLPAILTAMFWSMSKWIPRFKDSGTLALFIAIAILAFQSYLLDKQSALSYATEIWRPEEIINVRLSVNNTHEPPGEMQSLIYHQPFCKSKVWYPSWHHSCFCIVFWISTLMQTCKGG